MDSTIKKESDLPAADPNTPIPLKYEDRSEIGAAETGISSLLERGQDYEVSKNFSVHGIYKLDIFNSKLSCAFYLAFQHVDVISGTISHGPEAPNALRDDSRVVAAPDEATVLL